MNEEKRIDNAAKGIFGILLIIQCYIAVRKLHITFSLKQS